MFGKVKRVMGEKGFGFITGDDTVDYFVHHSACLGFKIEELNTGDRVEFTAGEGAKGPRAESVSRA